MGFDGQMLYTLLSSIFDPISSDTQRNEMDEGYLQPVIYFEWRERSRTSMSMILDKKRKKWNEG
jgi:hypothetical protein